LIAQTGFQFDLNTSQGKLNAHLMASLAEFERDLMRERVHSGLAAAKARGQKIGRQPRQRVKSDRLAPLTFHAKSPEPAANLDKGRATLLTASSTQHDQIYRSLLKVIVHKSVPARPSRTEPRVRSVVRASYPLMKQPRHELRRQLQTA
jgi:DNA invertase Pin-like site-specific DNA recombinase